MTAKHQQRDDPEIKRQRHRGQAEGGVSDPRRAAARPCSLDFGRRGEAVIGRRRGQRPFQTIGSAPSHTLAVAFLPPRMHCTITIANKICEAPKPKPPIEDTMFQSVNCTA